jgi:signal transduction histidine kinase
VPVAGVQLVGAALVVVAILAGNPMLGGVVAVTSVLLSLLLYDYLAQSITSDLRAVRRAAAEFRSGNFEHRARVRSRDELGRLARAMNQMGERLVRTTVDRDQLDNILMSMRDALLVIDRDGIIRTVNNARPRPSPSATSGGGGPRSSPRSCSI